MLVGIDYVVTMALNVLAALRVVVAVAAGGRGAFLLVPIVMIII